MFEALDKLPKTIKILGFTATEVRMDNRNVIEEIFNNVQTKPIGLIEAIQENYLPNPEYHCGLYEITTKEKERILKLNDEPLKNQILNYDIDESIENIFKENLDLNKDHKIICFVDKISNIDEAIENIRKWIKEDINIYKIHSRQSKLLNKEQIEIFQNTKGINIIFAVNMLNEGVHFPGIDCIIFLRKTSSNIVYSQQLGRVLGDNIENPKVFDLVNNVNNLNNSYAQLISDRANELKIKPEEIRTKNGEYLKIITHQIKLIDALKKLSNYYTEAEDQAIINNKDKSITEISNLDELKGRTKKSIEKHMIEVLGIQPIYDYKKKEFWSKEEDDVIYELHNLKTYSEIAKIISEKYRKVTTAQVHDRCSKRLKIKCKTEDRFEWTEGMIQELKELSKNNSIRDISDKKGWPLLSIKHKCKVENIKPISHRSKRISKDVKKEMIKIGLNKLNTNISKSDFLKSIGLSNRTDNVNLLNELDIDNKTFYIKKGTTIEERKIIIKHQLEMLKEPITMTEFLLNLNFKHCEENKNIVKDLDTENKITFNESYSRNRKEKIK